MKRVSFIVSLLFLGTGLVLGIVGVSSQTFSEPGGAFPGGNTYTPLNVGPVTQIKQGALTLLNQLSLSNKRAVNLKDPVNPQDAVTKAYVDRMAAGGWVECAHFVNNVGNDIDNSWAEPCSGYQKYRFDCRSSQSTPIASVEWQTGEAPLDFTLPASDVRYNPGVNYHANMEPPIRMSNRGIRLGWSFVHWMVYPEGSSEETTDCRNDPYDLSGTDEFWIYYSEL